MNTENGVELPIFDESIQFIRNYLPQELKEKFSDDDIETITDFIYSFYEEKGYMDEESGDDDQLIDIDEDEMISFIMNEVTQNNLTQFEADDILFIVQAEFAYCESQGMFE